MPLVRFISMILIGACALLAQSTTGQMVGTVRDQAAGVVPRAAVQAREVGSGAIRKTLANEHGDYLLRALPIGTYEVTAEAPGFKRAVRVDLEINVQSALRVDLLLEVGATTESVTVSGKPVQLETENGTVGNRVLSDQILLLPLNGRNPLELLNLTAGVDYGRSTNYFQVSGSRDDSVNLQVEGSTSVDMLSRAPVAVLPIDSVAEFIVKTSMAGADSGIGVAQVQIAVKSGANQFHGSLYHFYRGNFIDARDFFNPTNQKAHLVRNQFGGTFSGPIVRDRTFFFLNYEATRSRTATNNRSTVPTMAQRAGQIGGNIRDPFNITQLFPGGVIPSSRFDPTSLKILPFMPEPNLPGSINNYFVTLPSYTDGYTPVVRLDQQFGPKQRLSVLGRGSFSRGFGPGTIPTIGGTWRRDQYRVLTVRHDYVISPHWLNQFSSGLWLYETESYPQLRDRDMLAELGLTAFTPVSQAARNGFPDVRITGYPLTWDVGSTPGIAKSHTYTLNDDVSYIKGNHALKFGGTVFFGRIARLNSANQRGQLLFQGTLSNSPMADFLLGVPSSTTQDVGGDIGHMGREYYSAYLMDDWKATKNFTINIGVRYELYTTPLEANNRLSSYDVPTKTIAVSSDTGALPNGVLPQFLGGNSPIPLVTTHDLGIPRGLTRTDNNNWAPRFSFAYRVGGRKTTVVRGGYGWFYSPVRMELRLSQAVNNAPFLARQFFLNDVRNPLKTSAQAAASLGQTSTGGGTLMMQGVDRDFQDLLSQQWNLTIERDLGIGFSGRVSYIGNRGTHLPVNLNLDQDFVTTDKNGRPVLDRYDRRVNPILVQQSVSRSWYHAMESELNRRFKGGVAVQVNYTWAKLLSDADTDNAQPQDSFCLRCDRSDASYQRRHVGKFNFIYDLPFGPGKTLLRRNGWVGQIVGGWRLSGLGQIMTGVRYTPIFSRVAANADMRAGRPNLVGDPNDAPHTILHWYNTAAFAVPTVPAGGFASLSFGNAARNLVVGPGRQLVDLSAQKQIRLRERLAITLRFETFNAFNHANFGAPALDLFLPTAGVISSTSTSPRQTQFGLRFDF